jgi:preprotein translocase subunit SecA
MNQQRKVIYAERLRILEGENLKEQAHGMMVDVLTAYVDGATAEGYSEDWDLETLWTALKTLYPISIDHHDLLDSDAIGEPGELTREELLDALISDAERAYSEREAQLEELAGEGAMRQLERNVLLNVIDRKWREHLYEMDYLKEGINLRAVAQKDPVVEYQREGFDMFNGMLDAMKEEAVGFLFNVTVEAAPAAPAAQVAPVDAPTGLAEFAAEAASKAQEGGVATKERQQAPALRTKGIDDNAPQLTYTGPSEDGSAEVQRQSGNGGPRHAAPSRRERREAARKQAKSAKKG